MQQGPARIGFKMRWVVRDTPYASLHLMAQCATRASNCCVRARIGAVGWLNFYGFAHAGKGRCQAELPMDEIGECSPWAIFSMNQNDSRLTRSDMAEPVQ